jgi:hypothetical protein
MRNDTGQSEDLRIAVVRFKVVAEEFCSIIEAEPTTQRNNLLVRIYRVLPNLLKGAINLPEVPADAGDAEQQFEKQAHANVRLTNEEWKQLYDSLKNKLRDWDLYWQVFDPTTDKESVCGSLADDLADIYRDLKEGVILNETRRASPAEIIWNWRLLYYSHWGKHAMDALQAIHFRLQEVLE